MSHDQFESTVTFAILTMQLLAVVAVIVARVRYRSSVSPAFQAIFFLALLVAGSTAMISVAMGGGLWMAGAVTLPLMAVGATIDLTGHAIGTF
ncbi:MAG: hypothetical protein R3C99_23700 [Pirellulaceae bacterium]|nr:hypothetical protein [Planctomycetales bacterium]MCA9203297.1 hypothetical protein [Planctomycetales bacterium]MCA9225412.1 hypothetical protein [Planctomycetales bacterium]